MCNMMHAFKELSCLSIKSIKKADGVQLDIFTYISVAKFPHVWVIKSTQMFRCLFLQIEYKIFVCCSINMSKLCATHLQKLACTYLKSFYEYKQIFVFFIFDMMNIYCKVPIKITNCKTITE